MFNPKLSRNKKIVFILICTLLSFTFVSAASAQRSSTVLRAEASTNQPKIGEPLTINLIISNVQNLFGIDVALFWNPQVLTLSNVVLNLGVENHPNGVLHGNKLNYDSNALSPGDIYVEEVKVEGSYSLSTFSVGKETSAFTGSGTIATLTFNVASTGATDLSLESELSDKPPPDAVSNFIDHTTTVDTVTAVIPEIPSIAIIILVIAAGTALLIVSKKKTVFLNVNKPF